MSETKHSPKMLPGGRLNLAGLDFGRLHAIEPGDSRGGRTTWRCRCGCGAFVAVKTEYLRSGSVKSCGCLGAERRQSGNPTHNGKHTRLYGIWCSIKTRCLNPASDDYPNYGGRGITLCDEWMGFVGFRDGVQAAIGPPPPRMSLDRIDNAKGYEPGNVRWATKATQGRNQRTNRMETLRGVTQSLADWSEDLRIPYGVLLHRLRRGATFSEAVAKGWDANPEHSRRVVAALAAVESIPTEALEAGALAKALSDAEASLAAHIAWEETEGDLDNYVPMMRASKAALAALRYLGRLP